MKDLCGVPTPELTEGHLVDECAVKRKAETVSRPLQIKSFYRRRPAVQEDAAVLDTSAVAAEVDAHGMSVSEQVDHSFSAPEVTEKLATVVAKPVETLREKSCVDEDQEYSLPPLADDQELEIQQEIEVIVEPDPQLPSHPVPVWRRLRRVNVDSEQVVKRRLPLVDRFRDTASSGAIDQLRTRLLQTLRAQGWRRVAIASPTGGCGATLTTVNLAQSLSRIPNLRTVVMDMNFRKPGVASALALPHGGDMRGFLAGRVPTQRHLLRLSDGLAVGLNSENGQKDAAEIMHNPTTAQTIDEMVQSTRLDVALFDLPPVLESDDVSAFLPQVDGVLLVADGTRTTAKHLAACEKASGGSHAAVGRCVEPRAFKVTSIKGQTPLFCHSFASLVWWFR